MGLGAGGADAARVRAAGHHRRGPHPPARGGRGRRSPRRGGAAAQRGGGKGGRALGGLPGAPAGPRRRGLPPGRRRGADHGQAAAVQPRPDRHQPRQQPPRRGEGGSGYTYIHALATRATFIGLPRLRAACALPRRPRSSSQRSPPCLQ